MKKTVILLFSTILLMLNNLSIKAEVSADSTKVETDSLYCSLLTCSGGPEIYQYYGHSAIRILNRNTGDDITFNYGLFDFDAPHFIWRFILGQTNYLVGGQLTEDFLNAYNKMGISVTEQELNLTGNEKQRLLESLLINIRPENREYLYNFLYDNCATRVRDQIEKCIDGKVEYNRNHSEQTYRTIIHQFSGRFPWAYFGQDLLVGLKADQTLSLRERHFCPIYLMSDFNKAIIVNKDGSKRRLCSSEEKTIKPDKHFTINESILPSPLKCFCILFLIIMIITVIDYARCKATWIVDLILLTIQGLAGMLVTFLFFFSSHPTVSTNIQILLFNPFPLIFLFWTIKGEIKSTKSFYHKWAPYGLMLFIILSVTDIQDVSPAVILFAAGMMGRSLCCNSISRRTLEKKQ